MARTIRRKNESWMKWHFVGSYFSTSEGWYSHYFNSKYHGMQLEQIRKKKSAVFHSDKYAYNAPAVVRTWRERQYRSEQNRKVRVACVTSTLDVVLTKRNKDANWYYF